ncbi:NAD(P)H-hydrate dehydratase [Peptoniphilus sp. oral taxon 386]|uniref:NAD(P)H-hydrate dehydratase n=1 Tax=Peptoniphilus sp. oral taxon 386 TaxID=652713 RepID=UPI0001DA9B14|nr:NAD(P)H-hydrate dehydratase [Peptoniphilus sp. oral taxon 386]EFI42094.1 holo-[acyl-carrier-protein] synthase [Peptoniphilus sp. oral taxon 386 str. F0131]
MVGIDIVKISRVEKIYLKYDEKFLNRIFNDEEISYIKYKNNRVQSIAGLFAAKEAVSKAVGTGIGSTSFKDIKIYYENSSPYAICRGYIYKLSISHDGGFAVAVAIKDKVAIDDEFKGILNNRNSNTHKGDYGRVAIVAGSMGMTGSAFLASNAALRCGSGLVYNIVPRDILEIMSIKYVEPIVKSFNKNSDMLDFLNNMDSILIGPGIGLDDTSEKKVKDVLSLDKNIVVDADGLTHLAKNLNVLENRREFSTVLTPHVGEFSRLTGISHDEINKNREKLAMEFAKRYKVILLLKGNRTVVTNGKDIYINKTGNPSMATAGSGDVLSGILVSLVGRKIELFKASSMATNIHGAAGDLARDALSEESVIASDIILFLSKVLVNY